MEDKKFISDRIQASIEVKQNILKDAKIQETIALVVREMAQSIQQGGKILLCGNGGSAADAQHIAAELTGRFYKDREPFYAEALHVNSSYMTSVANDYSFDEVYARMVKAMGKKGDVFFGISTSGNSPNVLRAAEEAKKRGMIVVGMTGDKGGKLAQLCHHLLNVPSDDTPRIQESHILIGHILCEMVELKLS